MKKSIVALIMIVLGLAACGPQSSETLPTLIPTPGGVEAATATPVQPTQPPTAAPLTRATLPPTWTPAPGSSDSSTNTVSGNASSLSTPTPETLNTPLPPPTELPTLVVCGTFVADRSRSTTTFTVGQSPQILWTKVETAARYRIRLLDDTGTEVMVDFTLEPGYTFRPDLFTAGKVYAWSIYPEDSLGQQMCSERGAELYPQ